MNDVTIVIPTHKRQHNVERVAWYYSRFNMEVYILDSTPDHRVEFSTPYPNVHYVYCPEKTFYQKMADAIESIHTDFFLISPDDLFMKYEVVMECYEALKKDRTYSLGWGKCCYTWDDERLGKLYYYKRAVKLAGHNLHRSKFRNFVTFYSHKGNLNWTIARRDVLLAAFKELVDHQYTCDRLYDATIYMKALCGGNIYVSDNFMNYGIRSSRDVIAWDGVEYITLRNMLKYPYMRRDVSKFMFANHDKFWYVLSFVISQWIDYIYPRTFLRWKKPAPLVECEYEDAEMSKLLEEGFAITNNYKG
jgi:glycosyltransferase domain-containing protein